MKKRNVLMTLTMAGLMSVSLSTAALASPASGEAEAKTNQFWWPEQLNLSPLRSHDVKSNPYGKGFNYAEAFKSLDLQAVKKDIDALLTTSQDWWPSDYGNYGPFFVRLAWHKCWHIPHA